MLARRVVLIEEVVSLFELSRILQMEASQHDRLVVQLELRFDRLDASGEGVGVQLSALADESGLGHASEQSPQTCPHYRGLIVLVFRP